MSDEFVSEEYNNVKEYVEERTRGERRPDIAVEWFRRAASQGHVKALYNLACMFEKVCCAVITQRCILSWYSCMNLCDGLLFAGRGHNPG